MVQTRDFLILYQGELTFPKKFQKFPTDINLSIKKASYSRETTEKKSFSVTAHS